MNKHPLTPAVPETNHHPFSPPGRLRNPETKDCLVDDGTGEGDEGQEDAAARRVRIYSRPSSLDVSFSGVFLK